MNIIENIIRKKTFFVANILKWSVKNSPDYPWRKTSDPYCIMISEMLLRRTRSSSVIKIYKKFLREFPNVKTLTKSSVSDIEDIIKPLGMKTRSYKIKSAAETILKNYAGRIPDDETSLLNIIGKESHYTVNAIMCFGMNKKFPIFDVNVTRIFTRVFSINFGKAPHKKKRSWEIVATALPDKDFRQYNWALLDLGKAVCTPTNPKCSLCPLQSICDFVVKF